MQMELSGVIILHCLREMDSLERMGEPHHLSNILAATHRHGVILFFKISILFTKLLIYGWKGVSLSALPGDSCVPDGEET